MAGVPPAIPLCPADVAVSSLTIHTLQKASRDAAQSPAGHTRFSANGLRGGPCPVSIVSSGRLDPAVQFLLGKVRDSRALGRVHWVPTVSSQFPAAPLDLLRKSGGGSAVGAPAAFWG